MADTFTFEEATNAPSESFTFEDASAVNPPSEPFFRGTTLPPLAGQPRASLAGVEPEMTDWNNRALIQRKLDEESKLQSPLQFPNLVLQKLVEPTAAAAGNAEAKLENLYGPFGKIVTYPRSLIVGHDTSPVDKKFVLNFGSGPTPPLEDTYIPPLRAGVPMIDNPPSPYTGEKSGAQKLVEGFTTPGQAALLPVAALSAPESLIGKATHGLFGGSIVGTYPETVKKAVETGKSGDIADLLLQTAMIEGVVHSATRGEPNASKVTETTALHGDVRSQQAPAERVSQPQGQPGVQPQAGEVAQAGQVSLSPEHQSLVDPHLENFSGVVVDRPSTGRIAQPNHETGQIEINNRDFQLWVDNDLKGLSDKDKAAAVKSLFEHEDIHLKTDPKDAEPFWNSLSPVEQWVIRKNYLKGQDVNLSPKQLGFEAIRNMIERANGLTRSDFVGLTRREKWSAQTLDHLANVVGKIRNVFDKDLSKGQRAILDKVSDNLQAARGPAQAPNAINEDMYNQLRNLGHTPADIGNMTPSQANDLLVNKLGPEDVPFAMRKADELLKNEPGETTAEEVVGLDDEEASKFFNENRKRGNATQNDAVLYGMSLTPDAVPELTRMRDQLHQEGMRKLEEGMKSGKMETPAEFGKVIWLNGAIEGAARKGPNYEAVTTRRRLANEPPAARRKGKPGEQEEFFREATRLGVPGEEPPQQREGVPATSYIEPPPAGATPQKVFPGDIDLQTAVEPGEEKPGGELETEEQKQRRTSGQKDINSFRPIAPNEVARPRVGGKQMVNLGKILTRGARSGGSELPVSMTKRVTVLMDKRDGSVHMVSTYPAAGTAYMVDPRLIQSERPNRPVDELLDRYQPIYSVLLKDPHQNLHQSFENLVDFQKRFGNRARSMVREATTGTEGIPMTEVGEPPGQFKETEPNRSRPQEPELRDFYNFFAEDIPQTRELFEDKLVRGGANASRQMITGLRKMARIEMAQNRGMSMRTALENVVDKLYENIKETGTRSEFIERTMAQSRTSAPEEIQAGGAAGAKTTGAREISTLRSRAPTTSGPLKISAPPAEVVARGEGFTVQRPVRPGPPAPEPSPIPASVPETLSPEAQAEVSQRARVSGETAPLYGRSIYQQLAHREVPKEPYSVLASKGITPIEAVPEDTVEGIQQELLPERQLMSQEPDEPVKPEGEELVTKPAREKVGPRTKDEVSGVQKALDKAESSKRQLDLFNRDEPPAARRKTDNVFDRLQDYIRRTNENISTAGNLSDQLFRLGTSRQADYDLAIPVIRSALKLFKPEDREAMMHYTDEMQVLKKSDIKLNDAQQLMYDTFLKPLIDQNDKMFKALKDKDLPGMQEATYMSRMVQDPHSLFSRMARGIKKQATEGSVLGQSASFLKRRIFKALEDEDGNRKLIALVSTGDRTKVISYAKGKAELMGNMPPSSVEKGGLSPKQKAVVNLVESRRRIEMAKLDREESRLNKLLQDIDRRPGTEEEKNAAAAPIEKQLSDLNHKYLDVEMKYPNPGFETSSEWKDKSGKVWKLTDSTIREIEGNTDTRYYKEPLSAVITQNLKLKQIYRANQFLEQLRESPDFQRVSRPMGDRNAPPDWRPVDMPEFKGLRIEPRTAEVLDLFNQERKGPTEALKYVQAITSFLKNSLFIWNPFVHEPNLLTHWFTARGAEWANPMGYLRGVPAMAQAFNDVLTRSAFRDQALRAGAPLLDQTRNMNKAILSLLSKEFDNRPAVAKTISKYLGYINAPRAIRAFGDSMTWGTNEVLWLSLIRETMNRTGLPLEDAISEVGKHMPTYRVPPRVLGSRLIAHVMRNPMMTLWGHYHYSALKSYGEMGKEIFNPASTTGQRVEGLGRVATIGFLMAVAYPAIDRIVQQIAGDKKYKMRRAGSTTVPSNLIEVARGRKTPEAALQSIMTPSPVPTAAMELAFNRNLRTGFPIYERRLSMDTAKDIGNFAAQQISPVQEATKVLGGQKSLKEFGLGMAGISQSRNDTAMSKFGRFADNWMKNSTDPRIKEEYKTRSQEVFPETDYRNLRSAIIRNDNRAAEMSMNALLAKHKPSEILSRVEAWKHAPFTGTKKTEQALMREMTNEDWDLWYEAKQERFDIANKMRMQLLDSLAK